MVQKIFNHIYRFIVVDIYYKIRLKKLGKKTYIGRELYFTPQFVEIGNHVHIFHNFRIEGISRYENIKYDPLIQIEDYVTIQQNVHITCASNIKIEKNVAIAANVTITDIDHPYKDISIPIEKQNLNVSPVLIKEDSKIYNNSVILKGTIIGKHSVVGANSVVSGVFRDYCIIVGAPAKVIKRYCFEKQQWLKTDIHGNFI